MCNTLLCVFIASSSACGAEPISRDVVIYGGSSGGIAAAIQVARMGKSVILIEPSRRIGGLTTNGLGQTDIGNKAAIGGISREFYERVAKHYANDASWKFQKRSEYRGKGQSRTAAGEKAMWTFEPHVALAIYREFLRRHKIEVMIGERLNRKTGVKKSGLRIVEITMESGKRLRGKMFIDATYEGDLLAAAGVSHTIGREDNATYGETLNGVQTKHAVKHQLRPGISAYFKDGTLLPGIDPRGPGKEGSKDHRTQAYCFRMCITDHPKNRIPFAKPAGYDERLYELLFRNYEAGYKGIPWKNDGMPNRKTDTNNNHGFSTDFIGQSYRYPAASYAEREKIVARHLTYQRGLMWTLANHPRVPQRVRDTVSKWGVCKDEFTRTGGWPEMIYVREARRMISDYVMTQHNCQGRKTATDPVGLAAYTMDSHNVQRYVDKEGRVRNEGDVQVGGFSPYPISYQSLVPKKTECNNLFVPVCLSASHIAFGSIRMEPVFMVLGQSCATAACLAIDDGVAVQNVDYEKLRARLLKDKQILKWTGPKRTPGLDPAKLAGIVVDDSQAMRVGFAGVSQSVNGYVGRGYRHDGDAGKGSQSAVFVAKLPAPGVYEVRYAYTPHANRASNVQVKIQHENNTSAAMINQRKKPTHGPFVSLGKFRFGKTGTVRVVNTNANGYVIIDAVQFLPVKK